MKEPPYNDRSCPIYEADRSLSFLTPTAKPVESTLTVWAVFAFLLVLAVLTVGGCL